MHRPIATYNGRGVGKSSVLKWQHCIIYTGNEAPQEMEDEAPKDNEHAMQFPIPVRPTLETDIMDPASRLNFGKMYTVEHNVRVYDFGMVVAGYIPILIEQWHRIMGWVQRQPDTLDDSDDEPAKARKGSRSKQPVGLDPISEAPIPDYPTEPPLPVYIDYAEAKSDYNPPASETRQISLRKGDRIAIIEWPYENWAKGYNQRSRKIGIAPLQYMTLFASAWAAYDYKPDQAGFVEIERGDDLSVIEHRTDGWSTVWHQKTAESGLVPTNYITEEEPS